MTSYLKAIVGALVAGLGSLYQALDNGAVTAQEWVAVAIATLAAGGVVWGAPNRDPEGVRQDESVQPPDYERGEAGLLYVLVVCIVVVVLILVLSRLL